MKRTVEHIQRITYSITEEQVRELIRRHAHDLAKGTGHQGPVFNGNTVIKRIQTGGGYDIITEYLEEKPTKP